MTKNPADVNLQPVPRKPWTPEQAKAANAKSVEANRAKWLRLKSHSGTVAHVKRSRSSLEALQAILGHCYKDFASLNPHSPQAERLSRTLLNLEQIRRIHTKGTKGNEAPPAVAQSGPLGVAEQEPLPANPSPVPDATPESDPDSSLPEMSSDL